MKAKCRHARVRVEERASYYVCVDIEPDGSTDFFDTDPVPTNTGVVRCADCGLERMYSVGHKGRRHLPAWVLSAINIFEGHADADT
jgi:hypothetical protein